MLAETSSPSAHPRRKTGDSVFLLQLLLSDKCSCTGQELLFFLGIASLQRQDCPSDGQPMNLQKPWKMCKACPSFDFSVALAPRLANAPFVETRPLSSRGKTLCRCEIGQDRASQLQSLWQTGFYQSCGGYRIDTMELHMDKAGEGHCYMC